MAALFANLPPFLDVPGTPPILGWEDERRSSALLSALGVEGQRNTSPRRSSSKHKATEMLHTQPARGGVEHRLFAETTDVLAERHLFKSRELPGETFLEVVAALKEKALSCKFGATYDGRVRDQVIHGVANAHVRAKLLSYGEALTLQKAEEVGRVLEALNKANAAFGENERLLGSLAGDGGSVQRFARG
ncbi:hypothetical protein HPB52_011256 [Rhipicephalus sanguineus]|uniref:Uncharacterized protein n=1 Tax=Rhipicephalus sanguineus TaxID=34632 RepID=A0A9D4PKF9_RHISA|nr:hypothetical protein HPB52_011256 [Rhipicephalus sanguineus]